MATGDSVEEALVDVSCRREKMEEKMAEQLRRKGAGPRTADRRLS